jgi:uncharacterized protein
LKKHYYSWTDIEESILGIAAKIEQDKWKPDIIIGIANGGSIPATLLSKAMNIPCKIVTVQLRDGTVQEQVDIQGLYRIYGMNILIVDEINDTGETLDWIIDNWDISDEEWRYNTKIAVLTSKETSRVTPDYSFWLVDEPTWYSYPWETFIDNDQD